MTSLEQLIRKSLNPFDPTTFKPGNFWKEKQDQSQEVTSIHEHVVDSVEQTLTDVLRDRKTRTMMLLGDSGSGKSHLLGRVKRRLNDRACFAYVGPWPDSQFIWRHVLRQTVDSLIAVPEGETESQLLRWLKGLEIFRREGIAQRLFGERNIFIRDMRASYPTAYHGKDFFSALYALLDPELRIIATDWLRGEDLDEEDLKLLRVNRSVDSENAAQKMLSNLGWLADSTQPIVICFDNLDNVPDMPNGQSGLKAMFNVNTTIHNAKLKNFLVLISLITSNWRINEEDVDRADRDRVDQQLTLRSITVDQAAAIWASRLRRMHKEVNPKPDSAIAPLTKDWLEHKYPGGRLDPRSALMLAEQLIREYKQTGQLPEIPAKVAIDHETGAVKPEPVTPSSQAGDRAHFELMWQKEFRETGDHLRRIAQFSSPELIRRLQEALEALDILNVQHAILPSPTYASYSLGCEHSGRVCIVWTEDANLTSFYHVMRACGKLDRARTRDRLYLIRKEKLGTSKNKGYQLFEEIFSGNKNVYLKPDLESVQYLETYHRLVNAAAGGELVIGAKTPDVKELQKFIRESGILSNCGLLRQLSVTENKEDAMPPVPQVVSIDTKTHAPKANQVTAQKKQSIQPSGPSPQDLTAAERYILNLMTAQSLMGMQILVENTQETVPALDSADVISLIHSLCEQNRIQLLDPNAKPENQLLCHIPISA